MALHDPAALTEAVYQAARAPLDAAIVVASQWTLTAAPIVKAIFALEDAQWTVNRECDDRTADEARSIFNKANESLRGLVEGIRDNFLCDVTPSHVGLSDDDVAGWDARDEFIDEVERSVPSVAAFFRQMELAA